MSLSKEEFAHLMGRLQALTPALTEDVLEWFKTNPEMVNRYGVQLRNVAEQGVVAFRDVLMGAVEFGAPSILDRELTWLNRLLTARHLEGVDVATFLAVFSHRVQSDLTDNEKGPLLAVLEQARAKLQSQPNHPDSQ